MTSELKLVLITTLVVSWPTALLLGDEPPAGPTTNAADSSAASTELSSVIVNLGQQKTEFEQFMGQTLEPQLERIGQMFDKNVAQAETLLDRLQKTPADKHLRAQYEQCLSQSISEATVYLSEFSKLDKPTFAAIDNVASTIGEAQKAFKADALVSKKEAQVNQERVDTIRRRLGEFAQRYKNEIQEGKALPPEIEAETRLADNDMQVAASMVKLDELQIAQAKEAFLELQSQTSDLQRLRTDLQIAFRQGEGQQALLSKLASLKKNRLQAQAVHQRLEAVQRVIVERKTNLTHLGDVVKRIVEKDLAVGNGAGKTMQPTVQNQPGVEILRQYLQPTLAQKGNNNGTKH